MDQQQPAPPVDNTVPQPGAPEAPTQSVKQQVVEKVNGAKNVLVTVGSNPSVDELASALGLTFLLGKLQKHVTAVFSGPTPPAIEFLDPEKTFERSVDSLRDFIIALDKEKADKLRYKVEEDVVKVFITPYKTVITEKDLQFSQGDFNVDVVLALGVTKREDLDKAIVAHGRILHDAEVITINANGKKSNLGSVDWADDAASSVAEMLVSVSESFGSGLLDEQISTAFLTGIVAETNRFSNEKTSPKVMTMAAQLMAAGANQQLIATNLRQEGMISESVRTKKPTDEGDDNGEMVLDHGDKKPVSMPSKSDDGTKKSAPDSGKKTQENPKSEPKEQPKKEKVEQKSSSDAPTTAPEVKPSESAPSTSENTSPNPAEETTSKPETDTPSITPERELIPPPPTEGGEPQISQAEEKNQAEKPMFGGTLNATSAEAEKEKAEQLERERAENNQTLEHGSPESSDSASEDAIEAARKALEEVTESQPFNPANNPTESIGAQTLPPVREEPAPTAIPSNMPDPTAGEAQAQTVVQNSANASATTESDEPNPVDAFMQPHQETPGAPNALNTPSAMPSPVPPSAMPPLPPMPTVPTDGSLPPLPPMPPMPGQATDPTAGFQPQVNPTFMDNIPQSQNSWTQAGEDMAAKQAEKEANRQAKLDQMTAQYDAAVEKNRELQGKPPVNNDHSTFPLPPTS